MTSRSYLISGAGSGIGQAIAMEIAQKDPEARLFLLGRNFDKLEGVRLALPRPDNHRAIPVDLRNRQEISAAIQGALSEEKNLAAVIATAGVGGANHFGPRDRWDDILATNLTGAYCLVEECLPALKRSATAYRNVVLVSSILARLGVPKYTAYCASKAGLLGLARAWAAELAPDKILVNAICPGWVDTKMSAAGLQEIAKGMRVSEEEARKTEMGRVPLGKMSQPGEVAALVQFLVSDRQNSITGQSFDINGGALMP